jgi:membrane protein implicated in regulation of membrane protease activity
MQWWAWAAGGAILLGAELAFVDAQFYLVLLGASALFVGVASLLLPELPVWLQWLVFSVLAVVSMVTFRRQVYERMRPKLPLMRTGPAGEMLLVPQDLPPGARCRIEYRGSTWDAVNHGAGPIAAGSRAHIVRVEGLTLVLQATT